MPLVRLEYQAGVGILLLATMHVGHHDTHQSSRDVSVTLVDLVGSS